MAATDLEKLVVQLSADIKGFEKAIRRAQGVTDKQFRDIERRAQTMNARLSKIGTSAANGLIAPLGGVAAALTVRGIQRYADEWTVAGNKIAAAGQVAGRSGRSLEGINEIANSTRSGLSTTVDLYAKLLRSTRDVADSERDVARATEIVNKAFKAGGAAISEQQAGILQLSQGLGSGILQGDELRSVRENAPLLAQAIADEFKTTVAGLKQLGAEGQLTTDRVFKAILNGGTQIEEAFSATNQTISDGVTRVNNAFLQYIGQSDDSLSATERLVAGLNALADNFDQTADVVLKVAGIIAGALVGRAIGGMIVSLGLGAAALVRFATALRAASSAGALGAAIGGISAAAGPIGLLIGGTVVTALTLFSSTSAEASTGARSYAAALKEIQAAAENVAPAIEKATGEIDSKLINSLTLGIQEGEKEIEVATQNIVEQFDALFRNVPFDDFGRESFDALQKVSAGLQDGSVSADQARQALFKLANSDPKFQNLANAFEPLLTALEQAISATDLLSGKLAAVGGGSEAETFAYNQYSRLRREGLEMVEVGKAYAAEIQRQNSLSKEQLAVEKEIASIRKDLQEKGGFLDDAAIKKLAEANVAADAARSSSGRKGRGKKQSEYEREVEQIKERTAALLAETEAQARLDPTINDYGFAVEKAAAQQQLLNAAKAAGLIKTAELSAATPELAAAIERLATGYATAGADAERLAESQDKARQTAEEFKSARRDILGGFISDLRAGQSAADALASALDKVVDKLIDVALNSAFDIGGGGGGFFAAIGKVFGLKDGGRVPAYKRGGKIVGPGSGRSDSIAAVSESGPLRVSNGEYIVNAAATKKNLPLLEAINSGKAFANGGLVGAPRMPSMDALRRQPSGGRARDLPNVTIAIDATGADAAAVGRLRGELQELKRDLPKLIIGEVGQHRQRGTV